MKSAQSRSAGVTLVELLVAVSVFSIIAFGAVQMVGGVPNHAESVKLRNDVNTINQAVNVYRAFGGSLDNARTPKDVLRRLKTRADGFSAESMPGLSGGMIDRRLSAVMQTPAESSSDQLRAIWNQEKLRFEIARQGDNAVKRFDLDEALAALPVETESRSTSMKLATRDNWIWDFRDRAPTSRKGLTEVATTPGEQAPIEFTTTLGDPEGDPDPDPKPRGKKVLKAPKFSIKSGNFPITDFSLALELTNPNKSGVSRVVYSLGGDVWTPYAGTPVTVTPGMTVTAYAESIDPKWLNSTEKYERYGATPAELEVPRIQTSAPRFDYGLNANVAVTLQNPNDPEVSVLEYRLSGSRWQPYIETFVLSVDDNPIGATIEARAIPSRPYYLDSDIAYEDIKRPAPWFSISGASEGEFSNPEGSSDDMVTNLGSGASSELFTWGAPAGTDDPSALQFTGAEFFDVSPGERFLVGVLDYYNGTIRSGSGADSVDLSINLAFVDGPAQNFEFTVELVNTRNNTGSREGDADFVRFGRVVSESPTTIRDAEYNLVLEFGETSENGFSNYDEFHVFEDSRATGSVYARLERIDD